MSIKEVKFPFIIKVDNGDYIKREIIANVIEKEEDLFLCRLKNLKKLKAVVFFEESELEFTAKNKRVKL